MILHPAQNRIAADTHRFRVLNCGRRFGKTTLALEEMLGIALAGNDRRVTYYAPTRDDARDIMWSALCKAAEPAITYKNDSRLELRIRTTKGGESSLSGNIARALTARRWRSTAMSPRRMNCTTRGCRLSRLRPRRL